MEVVDGRQNQVVAMISMSDLSDEERAVDAVVLGESFVFGQGLLESLMGLVEALLVPGTIQFYHSSVNRSKITDRVATLQIR